MTTFRREKKIIMTKLYFQIKGKSVHIELRKYKK
jgi:hypothetical protein